MLYLLKIKKSGQVPFKDERSFEDQGGEWD